ncbi:aspartate dehydrogenase [Butyrivibrio sp. VCD2006]|uniref:aspartate dehydrogenase n=1 Tax=Butyrivibrio sp. VCD2006 TaxID=1280664 RepID=UPI0004001720|nr:aspartate dehydrogenase [Butyrivibrio sp. VCD2006]
MSKFRIPNVNIFHFGKKPNSEQYLSEDIPFDPDKQIAVIKCSICTGEQVAGFRNKEDGHFTEVMLIRDDNDLEKFKEIYKLDEIKKEY